MAKKEVKIEKPANGPELIALTVDGQPLHVRVDAVAAVHPSTRGPAFGSVVHAGSPIHVDESCPDILAALGWQALVEIPAPETEPTA